MSIKSRKSPVVRPPATFADARTLGLVLAALPGLAFAAQSESTDGERVLRGVVVSEEVEDSYKAEASSPKFTAPLLDTPQTVTVITKQLLDDQGVGSLADALRNTPGITFTLGENGNTTAGDSITMRGFDTSGSIFLDGIRDLGAISRDTFNIEQIEVVKGPSGSDIGRASPTGYINQASKQATLTDTRTMRLSGGTDSRARIEADWNQTLGASTAARLNLMYDQGDKPGRDVADNRKWGIAPTLALGLGTSTRVHFNYLFMKQLNTPDGGLPPIGLDGYNYVSNVTHTNPATGTPPTSPPLTQTQLDNLLALNNSITAMVAGADPVDRSNFYGSPDDYENVRANMYTVALEHDLSPSTTLTNTSRYGRYSLRRVITGVNALGNLYTGTTAQAAAGTATLNTDPSVWTLSRSHQRRDESNTVLTNQTNLRTALATGGIEHTLSVGVEFIYESHGLHPSAAIAGSPTQANANLYNPSTSDGFSELWRTGAYSEGKVLTGAVYAFDNLQFTDYLSLNLGARVDSYRIESTVVPAPGATTGFSAAQDQDTLFTGKAGLVYKPLENGSVYVSYASAQQPPGGQPQSAGTTTNFNLGSGAGTTNPNVDPQKSVNIEVGTKWNLFDNALSVSVAAFDTRNKNDVIAAQDPITGEYPQNGERKVQGIELGVAGSITPNWLVSAGLASMKTRVVDGNGNTDGAQLTFSPKLTFTSWTTYTLPMGLRIGGGARYVDSAFRNGNATQATVTNLSVSPDYWVVDLMAGYEVNDRIGLQLNVQNVTDKFYFTSLNNGGSRYNMGAPRTFLLNATMQF